MTQARPQTWLDSLRTLPTSGLRSIFPPAEPKKAARPMDADAKQVRRVERRRFIRLEQAGSAAKHIGKLPEPGEVVTSTMSGAFHGWSLVGAILELAAPAVIAHLDVSTLGYNRENAQELFAMLDDGRIGSARFLASTYFKSVDPGIYAMLSEGLAARGQTLCICRVHAKVLLFELDDGRTFTIESSANLRSCRNLEVFSLSAEPALLQFHREWMQALVTKTQTEGLR